MKIRAAMIVLFVPGLAGAVFASDTTTGAKPCGSCARNLSADMALADSLGVKVPEAVPSAETGSVSGSDIRIDHATAGVPVSVSTASGGISTVKAGGSGHMGARKVKRVITQKENGREVELMAGETFQVSLPENPTTGYRWTVYGSSATLVGLEKEEYDAPGEDPARPMLGRGGTRVLTFKAAEPGAVELVLRLRRSWEKESEFAASFSVKLKILERPALR